MKPGKEIEIRRVEIRARYFEIALLLIAQTQRCHLIDFVAKFSAEAIRKSMLATIDKGVARMGIRKAFDHGVLHRDLIEVIIQQRCQHEIPSLE